MKQTKNIIIKTLLITALMLNLQTFAFAEETATETIVTTATETKVLETVIATTTATTTATATETLATTTMEVASSTEVVVEEVVKETEDEDVDFGNDQAELDAQKDFTAVVRQSKDYYCGPASLSTLLTQLGNDTSESTILSLISESDLNTASGTNMFALKTAAVSLGNTVFLKRLSAEDLLSYVNQTQDPVLIHDEKKDVGGHFSVIKSYDAEKGLVELSDTEAGNIKYSVEDFKHIYTGVALIISTNTEGEILNNAETDVSDEDAKGIWGKYVPVYLLAERSGNQGAINASTAFKTCINNALMNSTVSIRNSARANCYTVLGNTLRTALGYFDEILLGIKYLGNSKNGNDVVNESSVGTAEILKKIDDKITLLRNNVNTLSNGSLDWLVNYYVNSNSAVKNKQTIYVNLNSDVTLLNQSISSKSLAITNLSNEINSGNFIKDNITFSLGTVGSQLSAQASTYTTLSNSLSTTLSNLDQKLKNAKSNLTEAQNNYNIYSDYIGSYNYHDGQYRSNITSRDYFYNQYYNVRGGKTTYNWNNYQAYISYASQALSNRNSYTARAQNAPANMSWWQGKINQYQADVNYYTDQKTQAQSNVTAAQKEKDRLQKLKDFGDTEIQRKRSLLSAMQYDLNGPYNNSSLQRQLDNKKSQFNNVITELNNLIYPLKTNEINSYNSQITQLQSDRVAELNFEKQMDNDAINLASGDTQNIVSSVTVNTVCTLLFGANYLISSNSSELRLCSFIASFNGSALVSLNSDIETVISGYDWENLPQTTLSRWISGGFVVSNFVPVTKGVKALALLKNLAKESAVIKSIIPLAEKINFSIISKEELKLFGLYVHTYIMGDKLLAEVKILGLVSNLTNTVNKNSNAILKNGYYEVNGFKFTEYYYNKLWKVGGRPAPSLISKLVIENATTVIKDSKEGFYKMATSDWEIVWNPATGEVWHLVMLK
jgi:predicted double-glycine peptidase